MFESLMRERGLAPSGSVLLLAVALLGACTDTTAPPALGLLVVSTLTRGNDPDPDGYQIAVDGGEPATLTATDTDTLILEPGRRAVALLGVAGHCAVAPGASLEAEIVSGRVTTVAFSIDCPLTGVRVSVATSGEFLDSDGYHVALDGADRGAVAPSGTVLVNRVAPGPHSLSLSDVEPNCSLAEPTRSLDIVAGQVVEVEFSVTCVGPVGTVRVTAPTTGPAPGPYAVLLWYVDDPWGYGTFGWTDLGTLLPNGILSAQVEAGTYWVELTGAGPNCSVTSPNPTGSFGLDHGSVVEVEFRVSCSDDDF